MIDQPGRSPDPAKLFDLLNMKPDSWQLDVLNTDARRIILNCSRQAGKSTVAAALALYEVLFRPFSMVIILGRVERQAVELFKKVQRFLEAMKNPDLIVKQ